MIHSWSSIFGNQFSFLFFFFSSWDFQFIIKYLFIKNSFFFCSSLSLSSMESSKHSLQDHHLLLLSSSSSSSSSSPTSSCTTLLHDSSSCYAATTPITGGSPHLCWTPNIFLNSAAGNSLSSSYVNNQSLQNHQVHLVSSSLDSAMTPHQDLSFHHWANDTNIINPQQDLQQFSHSGNIKREFSYSKKFSELISSSPSSSSTIEDHHHHHHHNHNQCSNSSHHRTTTNFFSQIYPTINISSSSSSSSSTSSTTTFDMNLQALDLFHYSARSLMQDQLYHISSSRRNGGGILSYNALHHDNHHYMQRPFTSTNMTVLPFSSTGEGGVTGETKRSEDDVLLLETKATHEAEVSPAPANKRSRLESRASCTPFKVRKEKLGDRIAALQQLVAPFGKTDTASVLMEAIGYIKFLQNQVETLSVPYLKSSRNKTQQRPIQGGTVLNEERKRDLRSRGLCLVPLSCLSYMTDSGGAVWPPPNFGGGT